MVVTCEQTEERERGERGTIVEGRKREVKKDPFS